MDKATKELLAMVAIVHAVIGAAIIFIAWAIWDSVG